MWNPESVLRSCDGCLVEMAASVMLVCMSVMDVYGGCPEATGSACVAGVDGWRNREPSEWGGGSVLT